MPVTAGHVPGLTSRLRRVPMDPRRFHSGRWFLLAEGVLVSAFGIVGLVAAALVAGLTGQAEIAVVVLAAARARQQVVGGGRLGRQRHPAPLAEWVDG